MANRFWLSDAQWSVIATVARVVEHRVRAMPDHYRPAVSTATWDRGTAYATTNSAATTAAIDKTQTHEGPPRGGPSCFNTRAVSCLLLLRPTGLE